MPKRYGNIYKDIIDIENIKKAHRCARKDKSFYSAVKKTDKNLDKRAEEIHNMLKTHSYKVSPYSVSIIKDKTKKRILYKLPYYPDRIIQWAFMLQLEPIFKEVFVDTTCASIPKKGIRSASACVDKWINVYPEETKYCLKFDIKKFYPSINREILKKMLRKKIKDNDLLIELDKIIDSLEKCDISKLQLSEEEKSIYSMSGKGIPVGSYLSQYLANFYLSYFDHWLKEVLKCKYMVRYMDDIVIFSSNKEFLWDCFYKIKEYLKTNLDLEIKSNYQIFPVDSRGVDFVGYRHFRGYKLLRKSTLIGVKDMAKKVIRCQRERGFPNEKLWSAWVSSLGLLAWCDSDKIYAIYYINSIPIINGYYWLYKRGKKRSIYYIFMQYGQKHKRHKKYYNSNNKHHIIHGKREEKYEVFRKGA